MLCIVRVLSDVFLGLQMGSLWNSVQICPMIHDLCIIQVYTLIVPTNAHKYIKISFIYTTVSFITR
jgi:hypothetical protein